MLDNILTPETTTIAIGAFILIAQSNYFATKLDIANIKLEMAKMVDQLRQYSDEQDKEILHEIDAKFDALAAKIDLLK